MNPPPKFIFRVVSGPVVYTAISVISALKGSRRRFLSVTPSWMTPERKYQIHTGKIFLCSSTSPSTTSLALLVWLFPFFIICSAAVCSRSCWRAVLQLQWKRWERFDHGLCRSASALKGLDQFHSACKFKIELQLSCRVSQTRPLRCCFFYCEKTSKRRHWL